MTFFKWCCKEYAPGSVYRKWWPAATQFVNWMKRKADFPVRIRNEERLRLYLRECQVNADITYGFDICFSQYCYVHGIETMLQRQRRLEEEARIAYQNAVIEAELERARILRNQRESQLKRELLHDEGATYADRVYEGRDENDTLF